MASAPKQIIEFTAAGATQSSDVLLIQQGPLDTPLARITIQELLDTAHNLLTVAGAGSVGGDFSVATNKFTVAAATGDTAVAGALGVTGATTLKNLNINVGSHNLTGAYSASLAPLNIAFSLPRITGTPAEGLRAVNKMTISSDNANPTAAGNQAGQVVAYEILHQLGTSGGDVSLSWEGNRTVNRGTLTDRNSPASSLLGPQLNPNYPTMVYSWEIITSRNGRGGIAPEYGKAQGTNLLNYKRITHQGGKNLNVSRAIEYGFIIDDTSSVRRGIGATMNLEFLSGTVPPEQLDAFRAQRGGRASPGWRRVLGLGGTDHGGPDPLDGQIIGYSAASANYHPECLDGFDLKDVMFSRDVMSWSTGRIKGGMHGDNGTGELQIGTGRFSPTTTGLKVSSSGYIGPAVGTVYYLDAELVQGNPVVTARQGVIGDDIYGGVYRFFSIDQDANEFGGIQVLRSPVVDSIPSDPVLIYLRDASTGKTPFIVLEASTTTAHRVPLTATLTDYYNGRDLVFYSGPAAGERRTITGWDPDTRILTTDAFSTIPTAEVNSVVNPKFASLLPTTEDTIVNGWQYTLNGGTGSVTRQQNPSRAVLIGDGVNAASLDQEITLADDVDCAMVILAGGRYRLMIGTERGGNDVWDQFVSPGGAGEDDPVDPSVLSAVDVTFRSSATTQWLRLENQSTQEAIIKSVLAATVAASASITIGIRAGVEAVPLELNLTGEWEERDVLDIQPDGGVTKIGGGINAASLPTSSAGLSVGDLYIDSGTVKAVTA